MLCAQPRVKGERNRRGGQLTRGCRKGPALHLLAVLLSEPAAPGEAAQHPAATRAALVTEGPEGQACKMATAPFKYSDLLIRLRQDPRGRGFTRDGTVTSAGLLTARGEGDQFIATRVYSSGLRNFPSA